MAHRIITQIVVTGARVFSRAFAEAWKQAAHSQRYANASSSGAAPNTLSSHGLTLDEACRILNVAPPKGGKVDVEHVFDRFKRLFDMNDPQKGGSFYLQSKVLRARERIEREIQDAVEKEDMKKMIEEGWKPKVWKNR